MLLHLLSVAAAVALAASSSCLAVSALNNGLGLKPQMGWNSWNHFHCDINEQLIRSTAESIVNLGLAAVGYQYINLDDCWQVDRDAEGRILADPDKFPSGIPALADHVHQLGLLFGLYSDSGQYTCQRRPGSMNYEKIDAATYASWAVDYLKYDNCYSEGLEVKERYPRMRDALNATGRRMFYSLCEGGLEDPATWAPAVGNSWRTTNDIRDSFSSMLANLDLNDRWWQQAAPGGWNDPDMLEVGNGGMTNDEYQAHFSLWALIKSPLLIGCDVTHVSNDTLAILTNSEVIALNQDSLGVQGHRVSKAGDLEVWAGPLSGGDVAVILFNRGSSPANISAQWSDIGMKAGAKAKGKDLWSKEALGPLTDTLTLEVRSHAARTVRLTPQQADHEH